MKVNVLVSFGVFVFFVSSDVFASTNDDLVSRLSSCTKISNNHSRLACFDELVTVKMKKEPALPIEVVKSKENRQIDDFSKQHLKKAQDERGPDSIVATISSVKQLIRGQWVVYLENGQKWQQIDTSKIKLKRDDRIRLKKGSLGAVYLFKEGSHRNIRVKRLK